MSLGRCPFCAGTIELLKQEPHRDQEVWRIYCGKSDPLCILDSGVLLMTGDRDEVEELWNYWSKPDDSD
jgi:hypothetical protein